MGQRALERQHQARGLAAGGHARHRLERFAGVGADQKLDLVHAAGIKGHAAAIGQNGPVGPLALHDSHAKAGARHLQVAQFGFHLPRQLFACGLAAAAQVRTQLADALQQPRLALFEFGSLDLPVGQPIQLGLRARAIGVDLLDRIAIFAAQRDDQLQPLFNLGQPCGVELQAVGVILQGARQVAQLFKQRLGLFGGAAHIGVNAGQPLQLADGLAHHVHRAGHLAALLRQDRLRRLRQVHERLGVAQAAALGFQLLVLAGAQGGSGDFAGLKRKQIHALRQRARILAQPLQLRAHPAQQGRLLRQFAAQRQQPGEAVQQLDMGLGFEQVEVFALAVHIHQQVSQFAQALQRHAAPVDAADVAPVEPHLAAEHHPVGAVGVVKPLLLQLAAHLCAQLRVAGQLKRRFDLRHVAACAHRFGSGALAQQQPDGVDDDGLPRARLAGKDVETGAEGEMQLVDDRKVANAQFGEHSTGILAYCPPKRPFARSLSRAIMGKKVRRYRKWCEGELTMPFNLGPVELGLILLIVAMLFGVGKLPEVFGSIGKGVREFRKESGIEEGKQAAPQVLPPQAPVAQLPAAPAAPLASVQTPAETAPVSNERALG